MKKFPRYEILKAQMDFPLFNLIRGNNVLLSESYIKSIFGERYGIIGRNGISKSTLSMVERENADLENFVLLGEFQLPISL